MIKTEPNDGAFACEDNGDLAEEGIKCAQKGLTIRQYYAGLAMQGLLAAHPEENAFNYEQTAISSVDFADALIAALNKTTTKTLPEGTEVIGENIS